MAASPPHSSTLTLLVLLPLIGWRVYSRFKRAVGRQRISKVRPLITIVLFPLLVLLIGWSARLHPDRLAWLAASVVVGVILGRFGLSKTKFEPTPEGIFYTPNAHLGIALSMLFLGRMIFRFVQLEAMDGAEQPTTPGDFSSSALTLAMFGLLAGYYVSYAIGLVRYRFGVLAAKRLLERAKELS